MGTLTKNEIALKERFDAAYSRAAQPVMQAIERSVCGCDYGGNSWTTREQAEDLVDLLRLGQGKRLIDIGAGSGWPGLYLSHLTGCSVALVDLPEIGLRLAAERAERDGMSERVTIRVANAAALPFRTASFDAVCHSDLLCCLVAKRDALAECRRVIRPRGRMAFTVISIAPGLSRSDVARAIENAPDFAWTDQAYDRILEETGWRVAARSDLTDDYWRSCERQVDADLRHRAELAALLGGPVARERLASWRSKLAAIDDGLFLRELFLCRPA